MSASPEIGLALKSAAAHQKNGRNHRAIEILEHALGQARQSGDPAQTATVYGRLGVAHLARGDADRALVYLGRALELAEAAERPDLAASVLNDLGTSRVTRGYPLGAIAVFEKSIRLAEEVGDADLAATAAINLTRVRIETGRQTGLGERLADDRRRVEELRDSALKANHLLAIGSLYRKAQHRFGLPASWRKQAFDAYLAGRRLADALGEARLVSLADGSIGRLYEDEQRYDEALLYTRRAAFAAQAVHADDSLYLWEWQVARILKALDRTDEAIAAYRQAIHTLGSIRTNLMAGSTRSFRELVGPVFFELADLMLERTAKLDDPAALARQLSAVRDTLEQVKLAEVREYFKDECVLVQSDPTELDRLSGATAVIYPVLLKERTELLVSLPDGMRQFTTPVGVQELTREVRAFRQAIESYGGDDRYLFSARTLYGWLIEPLSDALVDAGVRTLVIVPDGPLRTIPMAALHDGQRFMIERFAFATTPGLTLTSPRPLERENVQALINGLTEAVQGFPPLPAVEQELSRIQNIYPSDVFRDQEFLASNVERNISEGDYSIVHVATHGQFDSDHTKSFLLAYDDRITMDRLQNTIGLRRYQKEPVELLVLSACQTAAGDDRAALGLAGVAIKAGARSALATLWFVNDESTSLLVSNFYEYLQDPANSKAEALRQAQLALVGDPRFRHPSYWAPFLLIGNWL